MIRSDGYPSYRAYLKKPNELTIEKEKAMSMVNCVDHTLIPRTLYEELAKGFRDGFMKGMESVNNDWKDLLKVSLDGKNQPSDFIQVKEIKKEKENMNTKIEKAALTDEDFRNNVTVKFGGKTCKIT